MRLWQCLANILRTNLSECSGAVLQPLCRSLGGLGLRKATRVSGPAHWASWADCLPMIHARHPLVATVLLHHFEGVAVTPCLREAKETTDWRGFGFEPPPGETWLQEPGPQGTKWKNSSGDVVAGWQHEANARVEKHQRDSHSRRPSKGTVAIPRRACWSWGLQKRQVLEELEVVADGLPLFGGAQLTITTLVSTLHCAPGREWRWKWQSRRKERTYQELVAPMESLSSGGHGHCSRGMMVTRNPGVSASIGQGENTQSAAADVPVSGTGVKSTGSVEFIVGTSGSWRCGCPHDS